MFSEDWDLKALNEQAEQILKNLHLEGWCESISFEETQLTLPVSTNLEKADTIMVVCSGYPEVAGVWSYTLLEQSNQQESLLEKASMVPYFREIPQKVGIVVLNPHAKELKSPPEASICIYISQLEQLYQLFLQSRQRKIVLLGYSLGGDVILRFLQKHLDYVEKTHKLIFIDPTPPSIGRRKLDPSVLKLVDQSIFYGLSDEEGRPGEFAEFTKMRLKIQPELIPCDSHGAMPNLVWPRLQKALELIH